MRDKEEATDMTGVMASGVGSGQVSGGGGKSDQSCIGTITLVVDLFNE